MNLLAALQRMAAVPRFKVGQKVIWKTKGFKATIESGPIMGGGGYGLYTIFIDGTDGTRTCVYQEHLESL